MEAVIQRYSDPALLIPVTLMLVILFVAIFRSTAEIPVFQGGSRTVIAFCVTALAIYGFDKAIVQSIVNHYVAMGAAILVSVAPLIFTAWNKLSKGSHTKNGRDA